MSEDLEQRAVNQIYRVGLVLEALRTIAVRDHRRLGWFISDRQVQAINDQKTRETILEALRS